MVLSFAIWLPIFFGLLVLAFGSDRSKCFVRWMSLFGSLVSFVATLPLMFHFDRSTAAMQFVEKSTGSNASTSSTTWVSTASRCGSWC